MWTTVGGVAARTSTIRVGTGVTCPIIRYHPAIVAQAAATSASIMEGTRFFLGVGTGEWLNEHIFGDRWPCIETRLDMLAEAISIMRALWHGDTVDHHGQHFTVENAKLFTTVDDDIPIIWAASGPKSAQRAATVADGLWSTSPDPEVVAAYRSAAGRGPVYGQLTLCYAPNYDDAVETAPGVAERRGARATHAGPADMDPLRASRSLGHKGRSCSTGSVRPGSGADRSARQRVCRRRIRSSAFPPSWPGPAQVSRSVDRHIAPCTVVSREIEQVAAQVASNLKGRSVGCAESITAGRIAVHLACVEHAVDFFRGGVVAYQTATKRSLLGVSAPNVLSEEAASQMATGVSRRLGVDAAVATTGLAGGDPEPGIPVGTVFLSARSSSPPSSTVRRASIGTGLVATRNRSAIRPRNRPSSISARCLPAPLHVARPHWSTTMIALPPRNKPMPISCPLVGSGSHPMSAVQAP